MHGLVLGIFILAHNDIYGSDLINFADSAVVVQRSSVQSVTHLQGQRKFDTSTTNIEQILDNIAVCIQ